MTLIQGESGEWETVIGLEVHAQVISKAKLFSGAATQFGGAPNSQVSLVDAAMPGMLPVLNRVCIEQAVRTGLGLKAEINPRNLKGTLVVPPEIPMSVQKGHASIEKYPKTDVGEPDGYREPR